MSRKRGATLRALSNRNARLLTGGSLVSTTGTWLQLVAQNWLVLKLTGSTAAVGATVALQALPAAALTLGGGLIVDRCSRRRLLLITQSAQAVLASLLAVLCVTGAVQLWHVLALSFATGAVLAVDSPAGAAFSAEVVDADDLPAMIALGGAVTAVGRVLGMALAGVVVAVAGPAAAFELNAVSFLGVIAALSMMRPGELHVLAPIARARGQVRESLRMIVAQRELLTTVVLATVIACFGRNFQVTMAAMVIGPLQGGAGAYGTCSGAFAVGALLGACGAALVGPPRPRHLLVVAACAGVLQVVAGLAPSLGTFVAILVPVAIGAVLIDTIIASTVQLATPGHARGRAAAVVGLAGMGGSALGAVMLGALADRFGGRAALVGGGVVVLAAAGIASTERYRLRTRAEGELADVCVDPRLVRRMELEAAGAEQVA
ncbi:MAG: transporter [Actinomycetia bacterium]|nr:transporter [Actinomycetes bacterium]